MTSRVARKVLNPNEKQRSQKRDHLSFERCHFGLFCSESLALAVENIRLASTRDREPTVCEQVQYTRKNEMLLVLLARGGRTRQTRFSASTNFQCPVSEPYERERGRMCEHLCPALDNERQLCHSKANNCATSIASTSAVVVVSA